MPDPVTCQGATTLGIVRSWRQLAKVALQWAVVIATAVILIRVGRQHGEGLRSLDLSMNFKWILAAAVATTFANFLLPLGWHRMIVSFGQKIAVGRATRLWCLAQTGRYLPTGLVAIASRIRLASKEGLSKTVTASSLAIETLVLFLWALFICGLFIPSTTLPVAARWITSVGSICALVAAPWLVLTGSRYLSKTKVGFASEVNRKVFSAAVGLLGSSVLARAFGTVCLAFGFINADGTSVFLVIGATYAGVVAGMVGITPAGLGVREGVLTAILASKFGLTDAAAFALISRAWEFFFEMLFLAAASWWGRKARYLLKSDMDSGATEGKL